MLCLKEVYKVLCTVLPRWRATVPLTLYAMSQNAQTDLRLVWLLSQCVCVCPRTPMDTLCKSVLHRLQFEKRCAPCKGEERKPVKCLAGIQTHMSSVFFLVSRFRNFIKRENELGLVWIVITNPCWLQMDPVWFLSQFLSCPESTQNSEFN